MSPQELKKALIAAGFEVYRTLADEVLLADRVRDNLIMDSGVRLRASDPMQLRVVFGLRKGEFPGEDDARLYDRVRALAEAARGIGYAEVSSKHTALPDPAEEGLVLDTYYEIVFAKDTGDLAAAIDDLRVALALAKIADPRR